MDLATFVNEFRAEAVEQVQTLGARLLRLERDPADRDAIRELFRAAHTLKGTAATLELTAIRELAHAVEDVLAALRDSSRRLDHETVQLLFRAIDRLGELVDGVQAGLDDVDAATLALIEALRADASGETADPGQASAGARPIRSPRVLLVEQSPTVELLETMALAEAGFQVEAVSDGARALTRALAEPFDLIVSGVETRGMGGLELAAALRATPTGRDLPIVLMSGDDSPSRQRRADELGVDACLARESLRQGRLVEVSRQLVAARAGRAAPAAPTVRADLAGLRLLAVDDESHHRLLLRQLVAPWDVTWTAAEDGRQALDLLRRAAAEGAPFDVAILDVMLPDVDGLELARAIKREPAIAAVRLIFLTALRGGVPIVQARAAGAAAALQKPVGSAELFDTLLRVARAPTRPAASSPSPRSDVPCELPRVLVVEDSAVNRRVTRARLERLGYRVDAVASGEEALAALEVAAYAAILMDCQLPGLDGCETSVEIRRREGPTGRTPIVALTAGDRPDERQRCLDAGMDDFLGKPARSEAIESLLERWIVRPEAIDRAAFARLCELREPGRPDPVPEIADAFLTEIGARLQPLRESAERGDADGLMHLGHFLHGSASVFGANEMRLLASDLESHASAGRLAEATALVPAIERACRRIEVALTAMLAE